MKKLAYGLGIVVLAIGLILGFASYYMAHFALTPNPHGVEDLARTGYKADSLQAGSVAWYDSLKTLGVLKDHWITGEDGFKLHACSVPAANPAEAQGTAIVVHGYRDSHYVFVYLVRMYREVFNYNVLFPDLQYHGYSEGDEIQMGWKDRLDVIRWIDVAHNLFQDDFMVLHGVSMGAATVMMTSGEQLPGFVRCFVEDCGYSSVYGVFSKELREMSPLLPKVILRGASLVSRLKFGWSFSEADCRKALAKCEKPMLFIHGEADDYIPISHLWENYNAKTQGYKEYWTVPETGHARSYVNYPEEYTRRVSNFLNTVHNMIEDGSINDK